MRKKIFLLLIFSLFLAKPILAYYSLGKPAGLVNDYDGVLTADQKQTLEKKLQDFETQTSNQISVVFINGLQGDTIENFAEKLFKEWGIGQKDKDNGVLILVSVPDRSMRIEVGYGLEGALTDAQSNWIINQQMKPAFQQEDYFGGVNLAVDKIIAATQGEYLPEEKSSKVDFNIDIVWFIFFIFIWMGAILSRSKSWWLGGVFGGVAALIITLIKGLLFFGLISFAVLIPFGLLFDYFVSKKYQQSKATGHPVPWWIGGGRGGGFGGGGFGGFGGGMSGGGGASGRW